MLADWLNTFETDPTYRLRIFGYSDCVGREKNHGLLRVGRAERVFKLLGRSARSRVVSKGGAPRDTYVAVNTSVEGRGRNRSVVIEFHKVIDEERGGNITARNCAAPFKAKSFYDYVFLVMCFERVLPTFTPRMVLSLLRQIYYRCPPGKGEARGG